MTSAQPCFINKKMPDGRAVKWREFFSQRPLIFQQFRGWSVHGSVMVRDHRNNSTGDAKHVIHAKVDHPVKIILKPSLFTMGYNVGNYHRSIILLPHTALDFERLKTKYIKNRFICAMFWKNRFGSCLSCLSCFSLRSPNLSMEPFPWFSVHQSRSLCSRIDPRKQDGVTGS